jgi:hypothetical protein
MELHRSGSWIPDLKRDVDGCTKLHYAIEERQTQTQATITLELTPWIDDDQRRPRIETKLFQ